MITEAVLLFLSSGACVLLTAFFTSAFVADCATSNTYWLISCRRALFSEMCGARRTLNSCSFTPATPRYA